MGIEYIAGVRLVDTIHGVASEDRRCVRFSCENTAIPANASQCGDCLTVPATACGRLGSVGTPRSMNASPAGTPDRVPEIQNYPSTVPLAYGLKARQAANICDRISYGV
jgi:hypothetical protein